VAGARALSEGDATAAEKDFERAQALVPDRMEYSAAVTIAREHRVTALVQAAAQTRRKGKTADADQLLAEAAKLDPDNQIVKQHDIEQKPATDMNTAGRLLATISAKPENVDEVGYSGPVHLQFNDQRHSFHLSSNSRQLIPQVLASYGIKVTLDDSVAPRTARLDVDDLSAAEIVPILDQLTDTFLVPLDEHSAIVGRDMPEVHDRLDRQIYETVYLPGFSSDDLKSAAAVAQNVFGVKQAAVEDSSQTLTVRASEGTLTALNATLQNLMDGDSDVLLDVSLYEVDRTNSHQTGVQLPQQMTAFNFESEVQQVVQANQSTINQAIASGLIQQGNLLQYAELLLASGLLNGTVFGQSFVLFGNGLTQTGLSGVTGTLNLALNSSDNRMVDQTQIRADNHQKAVFRAGERYPIVTSTFSNLASQGTAGGISLSGLSASQLALLGLSGAASLAGSVATSIPQIQYQDLGLTLETTPAIQRNGDMTLHFDLKLVALSGSTANGMPILNNRAFSGDVTMSDGQTAVILSSVTKQETGAISGTPGLDELPGFNDIESKTTTGDHQEIVLLVRPHILRRAANEYARPMMLVSGHVSASAGTPEQETPAQPTSVAPVQNVAPVGNMAPVQNVVPAQNQ
jgi:type II secretory pathway component GspD/PulD (secretin)